MEARKIQTQAGAGASQAGAAAEGVGAGASAERAGAGAELLNYDLFSKSNWIKFEFDPPRELLEVGPNNQRTDYKTCDFESATDIPPLSDISEV